MQIIFLIHKRKIMIYTPFEQIIMRQNPVIEASKIKKSNINEFIRFIEQENKK